MADITLKTNIKRRSRNKTEYFQNWLLVFLLKKMDNCKWVITELRVKTQTEQKKLQGNEKEIIVRNLSVY